jgi:hypothetical protein
MPDTATIDLQNRAFRVPGALNATVTTGPEKIKNGFGNGDCLLVAPRQCLFAVADASERHPQASRILLARLTKTMDLQKGEASPATLLESITQTYAEQQYNHKTTLSGVAISCRDNSVTAHLFHGGDSIAMVAHGENGDILAQSRPDMNFAGRSRQGAAITTHHFDAHTPLRIFLATDGFGDIMKRLPSSDSGALSPALIQPPIHQMDAVLRGCLASDPKRDFHDDIALMVFDPRAMDRLPGQTLIMGGTTPHQEAAFATTNTNSRCLEASGQWRRQTEALEAAGIEILNEPSGKKHYGYHSKGH